MPVLKQTSPTGTGSVVCAPKPRPQKVAPSARTNTAVAPLGTPVSPATVGSEAAPDISARVRPVAAMTAAQWRDGMEPDWRHLRTASVPTPVSRAAASGPPSWSMIESTPIVMPGNLWEIISRRKGALPYSEFSSGNPTRGMLHIIGGVFLLETSHGPARAIHRSAQGVHESGKFGPHLDAADDPGQTEGRRHRRAAKGYRSRAG